MTETDIQNSILEFLSYKGIFAWRVNSVGVYDERSRIYRKKGRFEINGVSDINGCLSGGRFLAIEVKRNSKAKVSDVQIEFINNINKKGGLAFVAWSIDCVENKFKEEGII